MPKLATMVAGGLWPEMARAVNVGEQSLALTSAGTTQADAYAITKDFSWFGTVASSSGAVLPDTAEVGDVFMGVNAGANALSLYPPVGGNANGNTTNAAVSVASKKMFKAAKITATDWAVIIG